MMCPPRRYRDIMTSRLSVKTVPTWAAPVVAAGEGLLARSEVALPPAAGRGGVATGVGTEMKWLGRFAPGSGRLGRVEREWAKPDLNR